MKPKVQISRRPPSWWNDIEVPSKIKGDQLGLWLDDTMPYPLEHDYVLYTGSEVCANGWGASAAIFEEIGGEDGTRHVVSRDVCITGSYGSSVIRCELEAFLNGIHAILTHWLLKLEAMTPEDESTIIEKPTGGPLGVFRDNDRVTIMWHTDRQNLAKSLLYDEHGDLLAARTMDRDLWMRYSTMARCICVTPRFADRKVVPLLIQCDALCDTARRAMIQSIDAFKQTTIDTIPDTLWTQPKNQRSLF
jgi:hypothetical protein